MYLSLSFWLFQSCIMDLCTCLGVIMVLRISISMISTAMIQVKHSCSSSDSKADLIWIIPENGEWKELHPFGVGPAPRRRQGCVVLDNKVFFFGGTSPVVDELNVDENVEESSLVDHDDLFVLDMGKGNSLELDGQLYPWGYQYPVSLPLYVFFPEPTLKTLCLLKIIEKGTQLDTSVLPRDLRHELSWMVTRNQLTTLASGWTEDGGSGKQACDFKLSTERSKQFTALIINAFFRIWWKQLYSNSRLWFPGMMTFYFVL